MAFSNQNNKDYSNDVNTRGIQFSNKYGFDPSSIQFGYWNGFLSIRITPAMEKSKQTETRVYDYDKTVSSALTVEKISLLLEKVKSDIIPAINADNEATIGVPTGINTLIVVGTGKNKTGEIRPFIGIHKALNENTKKPEMSIFYEFNKAESIDNYDETTGNYVVNKVHAEFYAFIRILEATILGLSNVTAHVDRFVGKAKNDRMFKLLEAISEKLGIDPTAGKNYGRGNNVFANNSNYNNSSNTSLDDIDISQLSNIDEISQIMG